MMDGHPFTIMSADESSDFDHQRHEKRLPRHVSRMLAQAQQISDELLAYAAAARQRIDQIDSEHPDTC